MENIGFNVPPEIADYLRDKGYAEICVRDAVSHFSKFSKCAISSAPEHKVDFLNASRSVITSFGGAFESVINVGSELLRHHDALEVRRALAANEYQQVCTNELLDEMVQELPIIYSSLDSVQKQQWLLEAITTANLEATKKGNAIICKKLDNIIERLDYIGKQVDMIRDIELEASIYQPCQDIVNQYQAIAFNLKRNRNVPEDKITDAINSCCSQMRTIYRLRNSIHYDNALGLLCALLPALTGMIIQYYSHYYDANYNRHPLHDKWLQNYGLLLEDEFIEGLEDYLVLDEKLNNREKNEVVDGFKLLVIGENRKIEMLLSKLDQVINLEDYRTVMDYSHLFELQMKKELKNQMCEKIGEVETDKIWGNVIKMMQTDAEEAE